MSDEPDPAAAEATPSPAVPAPVVEVAQDPDVAPLTLAELRTIDLFDDLDDAQLGEWLAAATVREVPAGTVIAEPDGVPIGAQLLLEGQVQSLLVDGTRTEPVGNQHAPTWMGAIAVLSDALLYVRMRTTTACRIALVGGERFRALAFAHPAVHRRVMQQVAPVMGRLASVEQDRERLASLGTMAAGLAHELNNPAAAAQSAAGQLAEVLEVVSGAFGRFVEAGVERVEAGGLVALHDEAIAGAAGRTALDALDAADAEDALLDLLDELGVAEAWKVAEPLAAAGVDEAWVQRVRALAGDATDAALAWVAASLTARGLVEELQESTRRMSSLVGAVKSYAYLDHDEMVEVDVHEGLETTLAVLGHKLKHYEIEVVRDYDRDLPKLTIHGSEMNQVWTNLLHNAIQALAGREAAGGTITIRTRHDDNCAIVEIEDDGPGIPEAVRDRIFDAFFTTKDVGEGTGLGLATVRRIVVDRHAGSLSVDSRTDPPSGTVFHVRLPITPR